MTTGMHPPGNPSPAERGIPVLTEVLAAAPAEISAATAALHDHDQENQQSPQNPQIAQNRIDESQQLTERYAVSPSRTPWPAPAAAQPPVNQEEFWRQLAQDIHEQVLQQLLGQVNSLLKQQVAEQMAVAFEHVTQQLTAQIQVNLEQALQQSVQLAVEQEIEKTRMTQNKGF
jgi:catalase